ncbi:Bax inhibitor-1/YccA family protein [Catelliglobosispora koreensis]|uniref:Bax inhibitor-1/YccA family protein n=1 Tax=Catelliglobosispora koreensis TaxID=129052 RepID=UPI0003659913|nr:Bax inhibitor-1/YccA family protein [Catelliglobosispora koreensis]
MKSTNPVLGRIGKAAQQPQYSVPGQGAEYGYTYQGSPVQTGTQDVMTIDDVVVKTVSLIGVTTLLAAITWAVVPVTALYPTFIAAMLVGLVIGLIISFAQVTNPIVLFAYAIVEGIFLGAVSKAFETLYDGIVVQAVIATLSVFLIMAGLYKAKVIRATPMFMKVVIGAAAGLAVVMLINFVISLATGEPTALRDGSPIAIGFSLICIVVAALMFVVNFKQIEDGIAAGLPRKYGWLGAFGILVELIWMYLEFLRLLSYFMGDD